MKLVRIMAAVTTSMDNMEPANRIDSKMDFQDSLVDSAVGLEDFLVDNSLADSNLVGHNLVDSNLEVDNLEVSQVASSKDLEVALDHSSFQGKEDKDLVVDRPSVVVASKDSIRTNSSKEAFQVDFNKVITQYVDRHSMEIKDFSSAQVS